MKQKITKEMTIAEVEKNFPKATSALMRFGFHCTGCPAAQSETIEDLAKNNQMDLDEFLKDLNEVVNQ